MSDDLIKKAERKARLERIDRLIDEQRGLPTEPSVERFSFWDVMFLRDEVARLQGETERLDQLCEKIAPEVSRLHQNIEFLIKRIVVLEKRAGIEPT